MTLKEKTQAKVKEHYDFVCKHYSKKQILGVFLYGSWNYGTNLPDSDVDTKCILIPNLYSLAIKPYEVKHLAVDDEVCECMSIMHMVANWKKQNINFVEIMFTDYCIINPLYADMWYERFTLGNREAVARYDTKAAVLSMAHQALHTMKQDPSDPKKIMNAARILNSLGKLVNDEEMSYKEVIRVNEEIAQIRTGKTPITEALLCSLYVSLELVIKEAENGVYDAEPWQQECVSSFLNDLIIDFIGYRLEKIEG